MKVYLVDLHRPRRKLKENMPALYIVILGALAIKGWWSLWG